MKQCTKCGELKALTEFYAAKGTKDGLRGDCKSCHSERAKAWYAKNRERSIAYVKSWQQENAERVREYRRGYRANRKREDREAHLRRTFGLTLADYDNLLAAQGGGCAICGDRPVDGRSLHVDHDPDSGTVRGILCVRCNNALGQLKESVELVLTAAEYLEVAGFVPSGSLALKATAIARARSLRATPV